jgi:class 3 adenylate cyclase
MEPDIRYARAPDGTGIAFFTLGRGTPFVRVELPYSHLRDETQIPWNAETYEMIARGATLVRYDHRGFGLSGSPDDRIHLDDFASDLASVVDSLDLPPVILHAVRGIACQVAIRFAARYGSRVSRLILRAPYVRMSGAFRRRVEGLIAFPDDDWEFLTETFTRIAGGWGDDESARLAASLLRAATSAQEFRSMLTEFVTWDVSSDLRNAQAPTLVLHPKHHEVTDISDSQAVAAGMPNARLVVLDARSADHERRQHDQVVADFLGAPEGAIPKRRSTTGAATIILFADIADSTALTERIGDQAFREQAGELELMLRHEILSAGGHVVEGKLLGDGLLATFRAAAQAIEAALGCSAAGNERGLPLHVGVHAGDVIEERDNVFGGAVNIASRISALSPPGEVLVSRTVAELARTSTRATFEDRGEHELKGVRGRQHVFVVSSGGAK